MAHDDRHQPRGVWHSAKAAIPHIKAGGDGGSMVLTSSEAGIRGYANMAHYVSAKHGVVGLDAHPRHGARAGADPCQQHPSDPGRHGHDPEPVDLQPVHGKKDATKDDFAAASRQVIALPIPWVESVDISNALLFLASDEARYITGVPLPVDAGNALI